MIGMLKSAFLGKEGIVVYECRSCGATIDGEDAICPYCGPTDVVCYDFT